MPKAKSQNNDLVTKDYLDKRLKEFGGKLKTELKGELLEIKDEIVGEIKALREEFDAHRHSHARVDDTLEDHEKRIATLEKPQV